MLVDNSPAAIITADSTGCVLMANEAAHRMLALPPDTSRPIDSSVLPDVGKSIPAGRGQTVRTVMQSRGQRADGEIFLAEICFSTYPTQGGSRLAAMILDRRKIFAARKKPACTRCWRDRALQPPPFRMRYDVLGAIAVVHQNLERSGLLSQNKDFEALGNLLHALERIASVDLRRYTDQTAETI